jgi:hypothetical protein
MTSTRRIARALIAIAAPLLTSVVLFAGTSSAQTTACPAGGPGAAGGNAGISTAGNGGLAFTVPGFGSDTGSAFASGGNGGSAAGGDGGRGGTGTLPICNQNTNGGGSGGGGGSTASAAQGAGAAAAPAARSAAAYGVSGGLARTGAHISTELGLAGLALVLGGALLFAGQPRRAGAST